MTQVSRDASLPGTGVGRGDLVDYLDELLDAGSISDYCPNGLQVEGRDEIRRIVTGVSACRELFTAARESEADAVLVHHGIFWKGDPMTLKGLQRARVGELISGNLNLLAYHLPLDCHSELGNNALAARELGLTALEPFGVLDGLAIGLRGKLEAPLSPEEFLLRCREVFGQEPMAFLEGPDPIESVGLISGAAERGLHEAIDLGLDLFLTGEASEWVMNVARESGTHFVAAGHYATERLGIRALGEHLAERYGIEVEFVDLPNPV